jgi:DNA-directed RNA polymerase subunit E'/Rpb7
VLSFKLSSSVINNDTGDIELKLTLELLLLSSFEGELLTGFIKGQNAEGIYAQSHLLLVFLPKSFLMADSH